MAKKSEVVSLRLDPQALAKAFAVICGLFLFLAALLPALNFDFLWWNNKSLATVAVFYPGIAPTFLGALIALVWGAVSGAVFGLLVAWAYNKFHQ